MQRYYNFIISDWYFLVFLMIIFILTIAYCYNPNYLTFKNILHRGIEIAFNAFFRCFFKFVRIKLNFSNIFVRGTHRI